MKVKQTIFTDRAVQPKEIKDGDWFRPDSCTFYCLWRSDTPTQRLSSNIVCDREEREVEVPDPVPEWVENAAEEIYGALHLASTPSGSKAIITSKIMEHYNAASNETK